MLSFPRDTKMLGTAGSDWDGRPGSVEDKQKMKPVTKRLPCFSCKSGRQQGLGWKTLLPSHNGVSTHFDAKGGAWLKTFEKGKLYFTKTSGTDESVGVIAGLDQPFANSIRGVVGHDNATFLVEGDRILDGESLADVLTGFIVKNCSPTCIN